MKWDTLLSVQRFGRESTPTPVTFDQGRTENQRDFDRIVYSSAFRRLQDKTQVFPLANTDYIRTRLTHSLEVSSLGRSLGWLVGTGLNSDYGSVVNPKQISDIVATACIAHDIGNPPFGHSGEEAISDWFRRQKAGGIKFFDNLSDSQAADFLNFEGNAQGFRILTRLQMPANPGMELTYSTLSSYIKYPCGVLEGNKGKVGPLSRKKYGCFSSEMDLLHKIANTTGLEQHTGLHDAYKRHPLVFLVEAADDICYHIIDLEDAFHQNLVSLNEIIEYLAPIVEDDAAIAKSFKEDKEKVEYLRARAINRLMAHCVEVFIVNAENILNGTFESALVDCIPTVNAVKSLGNFEKQKIYPSPEILEIEYAGFNVVGYILDEILLKTDYLEKQESKKCKSLLGIFPCLMGIDMDVYSRIQRVTDWISGMSDSYAVSVYQRLNGSRLRGL